MYKREGRDMILKVQLCGKVTGETEQVCREKFAEAEELLFGAGVPIVINPLRIVKDFDTPWDEALDICLMSIIEDANAVWMLEDWNRSKGARDEHRLAQELGRLIFYSHEIERVKELCRARWMDTSEVEFP